MTTFEITTKKNTRDHSKVIYLCRMNGGHWFVIKTTKAKEMLASGKVAFIESKVGA